jgi:hypothetical protein
MAFYKSSLLCGWAYPLFSHLCLKAIPLDPNMESLWNGELYVLTRVEQVTGEEKYEVLILNSVIIWSRISIGSV